VCSNRFGLPQVSIDVYIEALQGVVYDACNFQIIKYSYVEYVSPLSLIKSCLNSTQVNSSSDLQKKMLNLDFLKVFHLYMAMLSV
jgi:hypothetical protein